MISVDSILSDKHDLDKLDDLCRLCGQLKDSSSLIFDINRSNYDSIINSHFKDEFQILKTDVLPLKICNCCLASVESWNKFYISTVEVNEKFLLLIDKFSLTKESKKKPADMMNNDIEVIEVSVEGDNYEFFNEQDNVNEFDITNIKYTHEFVDSNQFGDLVDEDVGMNDCEDRIVEHTSEKDSPSEFHGDILLEEHDLENRSSGHDDELPPKNIDDGRLHDIESYSEATLVPELESRCNTVEYKYEACDKNELEVDLIKEEVMQVDENDDLENGESKDTSKVLPDEYERFVVQYNRTGIRYMQCDKCQFICRPLVHIFEKHYRTHYDADDVDEKPDINELPAVDVVEAVAVHEAETFCCDVCNKKFISKQTLQTHQKSHRAKIFSCGVCGLVYKTRFELKVHKKTHASQQISLVCNMCGKNFKTKSGYNHHRANVCVEYKCEICGDMFLVKSVLQDHLKKVHDIEEDISVVEEPPKKEQASSVCPVCGKMVTENALSRHLNLHSEDKPYICDLCGKQFRIKWSLREHIMIEIGMKDYVCEICGKKFVIQAYLNKHMRFHMMCEGKFEGYQCEICGKKYAEEWKVKEHQRNSHKGKNLLRYKCDICDKKYTRKWLVRSHKRTAHKDHMEEYQCNFCDKKFAEKWIIKLHLQTVHNINNSNDDNANCTENKATPDELEKLLEYHQRISCDDTNLLKSESSAETKSHRKPFECELCGKTFATKQGMKNHLYAELNLRKYVCEICGKRYNWWMGLKEHSIMNHGEKEFVCAFCGKDFPTKKRCRDHLSVHSDDRPYNCKCGNSFKLRRYLAKHQKRCGKAIKKE